MKPRQNMVSKASCTDAEFVKMMNACIVFAPWIHRKITGAPPRKGEQRGASAREPEARPWRQARAEALGRAATGARGSRKLGKWGGGAKQILWIRPLLLSFRRPCFLSECHIARYLRDRQPRLELLLLSTCGELEWARESQVSLSELQRLVGEQSLWHVVFSGPQEDTLPVPGRLPSSIVCAAARTAMKSALER